MSHNFQAAKKPKLRAGRRKKTFLSTRNGEPPTKKRLLESPQKGHGTQGFALKTNAEAKGIAVSKTGKDKVENLGSALNRE